MRVLKFGGSSLGTLQRVRTACRIALDARELIVTDDRFTMANIQHEPTRARIRRRLGAGLRRGSRSAIPVVTGFIGATADGRTTTLGRDGSDYTAAILGAALGASAI